MFRVSPEFVGLGKCHLIPHLWRDRACRAARNYSCQSDASKSFSVLKPRKSSALSVISNRACSVGCSLPDLAAGRLRRWRSHACRLLLRDVAFRFHALDDLVNHLAPNLCSVKGPDSRAASPLIQSGTSSPCCNARRIASRSAGPCTVPASAPYPARRFHIAIRIRSARRKSDRRFINSWRVNVLGGIGCVARIFYVFHWT